MAAENRAVERARSRGGVIELQDLLDAGLSKDAISRRLRTGWLIRHFEAIYSIGALDPVGSIRAALLACVDDSMAIARSSAALWALLPYPAVVSVAMPRGAKRPPGIDAHELKELPRWTLRHGVRTARVEETLLSLAATATYDETLEATNQAFIARRTSTENLTAFLASRRGRRGVRTLREIVDGPRTRSQAEVKFFALLRAARLPLPLTNVKVNGHLVDFYWPELGVVVETDGWASHGRREQWESDHARDLDHFATGLDPVRITKRQLDREPYAVIARLGAVLLRPVVHGNGVGRTDT